MANIWRNPPTRLPCSERQAAPSPSPRHPSQPGTCYCRVNNRIPICMPTMPASTSVRFLPTKPRTVRSLLWRVRNWGTICGAGLVSKGPCSVRTKFGPLPSVCARLLFFWLTKIVRKGWPISPNIRSVGCLPRTCTSWFTTNRWWVSCRPQKPS